MTDIMLFALDRGSASEIPGSAYRLTCIPAHELNVTEPFCHGNSIGRYRADEKEP